MSEAASSLLSEAQHVVHAALSPRLAVLTSADVDTAILRPNGLPDFVALLRPFEESVRGLSIRTADLATRTTCTFPLRFDALATFAPPRSQSSLNVDSEAPPTPQAPIRPSPSRAPSAATAAALDARPEVLLDALGPAVKESAKQAAAQHDLIPLVEAPSHQSVEYVTPWYGVVREAVLAKREVSPHETFGWPVGVVLAVSSASPDPMNAFASLFEASAPHSARAYVDRPYMDPVILRYYVLVHDTRTSGTDLSESLAVLENVKKTYGLNACLLPLNSRTQDEQRSMELEKLWKEKLKCPPSHPPARAQDELAPPPLPPKAGESPPSIKSTLVSLSNDEEAADAEPVAPYASALNEADVKRLEAFVRELAAQGVVPFLERSVAQWNESLAASRRGLTGRLFGAGRKFWGSATAGTSMGRNSTSAAAAAPASFATLGYFPVGGLESQTRRLADFAFMTRDYKLAAATYDIGRKEFAAEKGGAVKYVAGATEMFGLAHLMLMLTTRSPPIDVDSYLASACAGYAAAPRLRGSQVQLDGLRATLLYYEVYRALGFYRSAPAALLRAAAADSGTTTAGVGAGTGTGEEEQVDNDVEVVGAILLEQAALTDLRQAGKPAVRKHAAHLVMAAHQYRECGQKLLSLNCFRQAAAVYGARSEKTPLELLRQRQVQVQGEVEAEEGPENDVARYEREHGVRDDLLGWDRIGDHVEHQLGRQAYAEGDAGTAVEHLIRLLRRRTNEAELEATSIPSSHEASQTHTKQTDQHTAYLEEFLTAFKYAEPRNEAEAVVSEHKLALPQPLWDVAASRVHVTLPTHEETASVTHQRTWAQLENLFLERAYVPGQAKPASLAKSPRNVAATQETFWVALVARNPLRTTLSLEQISVVFENAENEKREEVQVESAGLAELELGPEEVRQIFIPVKVLTMCSLRCTRVKFRFAGLVPLSEALHKRGPRLNMTREQRIGPPVYAPDETLVVHVTQPQPALELKLLDAPERLGLGEEADLVLSITNSGRVPLEELKIMVDAPGAIMLDTRTLSPQPFSAFVLVNNSLAEVAPFTVVLPGGQLGAGASLELPFRLRGAVLGQLELRWLFVFSGSLGASSVQTARFSHAVQVDPVVDLAVQASASRKELLTYLLSLEAVNLQPTEQSACIEAISFLSPMWIAETGQEAILDEAFTEIPFRQRKRLTLTVTEASSEALSGAKAAPLTDLSFTASQLRLLLQGKPLTAQPDSVALHRSCLEGSAESTSISPFLRAARLEWRRASLARQFPIVPAADRTKAFTLYQPTDLDVVAHWSVGQRKGQAFIFGLQLGPSYDHLSELSGGAAGRVIYAEAAKEKAALLTSLMQSRLRAEEDPLVVEAHPPEPQTHDFTTQGRLRLPVAFTVRNLSTVRAASFVLQLENGPAERITAVDTLPAPWIGRLTQRATLQPRASVKVWTHVGIAAARSYELGAWSLRCTTLSASLQEGEVHEDKEATQAVQGYNFAQSEWSGVVVHVSQTGGPNLAP